MPPKTEDCLYEPPRSKKGDLTAQLKAFLSSEKKFQLQKFYKFFQYINSDNSHWRDPQFFLEHAF